MKKALFFVVLMVACVCQAVLADVAKVKLKSGVEVKGTIVSFDPTAEIVLDVAGFETKINMADVESIEKVAETAPVAETPAPKAKVNPGAHPAVTHKGAIKTGKKGKQYIEVLSDDGQELTMDFVSQEDKTLKVIKSRSGLDYTLKEYIIPEYVVLDNDTYTVIMIGEGAFNRKNGAFLRYESILKDVTLPATLRTIEDRAFRCNDQLNKIIIPDSVENIGDEAFMRCGQYNKLFEELFIPQTIKSIGKDAFRGVGKKTSYMGYFQGNLTSMPSFITVGNCLNYGIDEEAVEDYYRRNGI